MFSASEAVPDEGDIAERVGKINRRCSGKGFESRPGLRCPSTVAGVPGCRSSGRRDAIVVNLL